MKKRAPRPSPPPKTSPLVGAAAAALVLGCGDGRSTIGPPPQIPPQPEPAHTQEIVPPQAPPIADAGAPPAAEAPPVEPPPPQVPPPPQPAPPRRK